MDAIDVKGLREDQVKLIRDFVQFLKKRGHTKARKTPRSLFEEACGGWKDLIDEESFLKEIYAARRQGRRPVTL